VQVFDDSGNIWTLHVMITYNILIYITITDKCKIIIH